ncbi:YciI family protein [Pseudonocardia sp. CA-107938]|uniref:YciI family protein n=1 Tax=Pseudonocardia sp. CA-107938 TaxID=3240021 RepID=UPI003D8F2CFC
MPQYLLSLYQPAGTPEPAVMDRIAAELGRLNEELRDTGSWVFTGGLDAGAAVVRADGMVTDGPYLEGKEHVGGVYVITAPDLDAALEWGRRVAVATTLPIEVRAFQDRPPF